MSLANGYGLSETTSSSNKTWVPLELLDACVSISNAGAGMFTWYWLADVCAGERIRSWWATPWR